MLTPQADLSTWLTAEETCQRLQISLRTLDRRQRDGTAPMRALRHRPGKKPEPVFDPADVQRMAAPRTVATVPAPIQAPRAPRAPRAELFALFERILTMDNAKALPPVDPERWVPPLPWISVATAAEISGLSQSRIRRLAGAGEIAAVRDGCLKIHREGLLAWKPANSENLSGDIPKEWRDGDIGGKS
jgi:hypothetical protein